MIKLCRVDHRLLHGQVAFSWASALDIDCILIANDNVVNDELRKTTMKLAKPNGIKLVIKNIKDSIEAINNGVTDKYKLFIVVESIKDAYDLILGINYNKTLNLGGTKATNETINISKAMNVTEDEIKLLKELVEKGVDVSIQMVPEDSPVPVNKVI